MSIGGNGPVEARVRDISRTGALLEANITLEAGGQVRLTCGGTHLDARVAWADEGCFGLEFDTPLLVGKLIDCSGSQAQRLGAAKLPPKRPRLGTLPRSAGGR